AGHVWRVVWASPVWGGKLGYGVAVFSGVVVVRLGAGPFPYAALFRSGQGAGPREGVDATEAARDVAGAGAGVAAGGRAGQGGVGRGVEIQRVGGALAVDAARQQSADREGVSAGTTLEHLGAGGGHVEG